MGQPCEFYLRGCQGPQVCRPQVNRKRFPIPTGLYLTRLLRLSHASLAQPAAAARPAEAQLELLGVLLAGGEAAGGAAPETDGKTGEPDDADGAGVDAAALLLEVSWRESIFSETLLQMMPPPIVMASRELHDLHVGGETKKV